MIEISPREARKFLRGAEFRVISKDGDDKRTEAPYYQAEVLHDGIWKELGETSCVDDIRTSECLEDPSELDRYVRRCIKTAYWGAEVFPDGFYVVSQGSDG